MDASVAANDMAEANSDADADISAPQIMSASSLHRDSPQAASPAPRQRLGSPVGFLPPLLRFFTRHVLRPVTSALRNIAVDTLGFSLGIATSLLLGAVVAGKRRTFRIASPPVSTDTMTRGR